MRVSDLYKQVAGLGFESSLEDDSRFYYAADRALLQIARIRPATRTLLINHKPMKSITASSYDARARSESLVYTAEGAKAYYFEADGNGTAYVEFKTADGWGIADIVSLESPQIFRSYRGFIKNGNSFVKGQVRIRFTGEYLYHVRRVALYGEIYSAEEDDIPAYEPFTKYDISKVEDFLALASPPIVDDKMREVLNSNYDVENGRVVLLKREIAGEYIVRYIKRPSKINEDTSARANEQIIELDDDLAALMPNLVAAYILAEDEPQLAEYYLALYNQQVAVIEQKERPITPANINLNGW